MRAHRNQVWDLIDNFFHAFNITSIPKEMNQTDYSLDVAASTFNPSTEIKLKHEVEMI